MSSLTRTLLHKNCSECKLHEGCKSYRVPPEMHPRKAVPPVDLLLVGEAPGEQEDVENRPFVGKSGQFLRGWLNAWGGSWTLTNAIKCRPPNNDTPTEEQIKFCEPFLTYDISTYSPKVIICLGVTALRAVWPKGPGTIHKARMAPVKLGNAWVVTTYHPSMHVSGRKDLTAEYERVFSVAASLLEGTYGNQEPDIREVESPEDLQECGKQILSSDVLYFDCETDTHSKVPSKATIWMPEARLLCVGVGTKPGEPVWVIHARFMTEAFTRLWYGKTVIAHAVKFDLQCIYRFVDRHIWEHVSYEDTLLMHSTLDQGKADNDLEHLAVEHLGVPSWKAMAWDLVDAEDARRKKLRQPMTATLADIPFRSLVEYNGRDVFFGMRLYEHLKKKTPPLPVYQELILPAVRTLAEMEQLGLGVSKQVVDVLERLYTDKVEILNREVRQFPEVQRVELKRYEAKGKLTPFNALSTDDLRSLLDECDLEVFARTEKTDKPSVTRETIEQLADDPSYPVWDHVRWIRRHDLMLGKFLRPYGAHIVEGRIHANYLVAKMVGGRGDSEIGGTKTGRLAVRDPALHNIKKDNVLRIMIRPRPGYILVEFDFSQVEVRCMAWLSGCRALIDACQAGDIYQQMASELWKLPTYETAKGSRWRALMKVGVLAVIYLETPESFAPRNGLSVREGREFVDAFFTRFPEVHDFQKESVRLARTGGFLTTLWGRRSTILYTGFGDTHADNQANNLRVQSLASDNTLFKAAQSRELHDPEDFRLVNLIHDAHQAEVRLAVAGRVIQKHKRLMEDTSDYPFPVPVALPVEVKVGWDGGHMRELKVP